MGFPYGVGSGGCRRLVFGGFGVVMGFPTTHAKRGWKKAWKLLYDWRLGFWVMMGSPTTHPDANPQRLPLN